MLLSQRAEEDAINMENSRIIKFRAWDKKKMKWFVTTTLDWYKTEIAYIAGFFDGEGCVRIKQANQGGNSYYLIAHITNTNPVILKKVQDLFGGNTRVQEKGRNKPIYNWYITSSEANDFLKTLQPFLIEKKSQAELGIKFHENKSNDKRQKIS